MPAAMLFLNLTEVNAKGKVKGEVQSGIKDHVDDIECNDWNWKLAKRKELQAVVGGKRESSYGNPSLFSFSKAPDRSSPRLMTALTEGLVFPKGVFRVYEKLSGKIEDTEGEFDLKIILTDVRVVEYTVSGRTGDKEVELDESWDLNYRTIEFRFGDGRQQVMIDNPPSYETSKAKTPVDEMVDQAKKLGEPERKDLINRLGSL